jgi:ABC-type sugar transport system permease subunit
VQVSRAEKPAAALAGRAELRGRTAEAITGWALLAPALAVLLVIIAWPLFQGIRLSLYEAFLLRPLSSAVWVGVANYLRFAADPNLTLYLRNQVIWVTGSVAGEVGLGFVLALILNRDLRYRAFWRSIVLLPWAMPIAATALIWQWIFNAEWGIANYTLRQVGVLQENISWYNTPWRLWLVLLTTNAWRHFPFAYVSLLAGFQAIPREVVEAAEIDGAGPVATFRTITLPLMKPVLWAVVLLLAIWRMNDFSTIWTMTRGGPGIDSMTFAPLVYVTAFSYFRFGQAASIGVVMLMISLLLTTLYLKRTRMVE